MRSWFFVFLLLVPYVSAFEDYDPNKWYCGPGWLPDGVVPLKPAGVNFNPACYEHDKCYEHEICIESCKTHWDCDQDFEDNNRRICLTNGTALVNECRSQHPYLGWLLCGFDFMNCYEWAVNYANAVRTLGSTTFECSDEETTTCKQNRNNFTTGVGYYGTTTTTIRPAGPPNFYLNYFESEPELSTMDAAIAKVSVGNSGEQGGKVTLKIEDCRNRLTFYQGEIFVAAGSTKSDKYWLNNLNSTSCQTSHCIRAELDDNGKKKSDTYYVITYSGEVSGVVKDSAGKLVVGASVTSTSGESAITDNKGRYHIQGINRYGGQTITAHHPRNEGTASTLLQFSPAAFGNRSCRGVKYENIDLTITQDAGILEITCDVPMYTYRLTNTDFTYAGSSEGPFVSKGGIVPGNYTLVVSKKGYQSTIENVVLAPSQQTLFQCGLKSISFSDNDKGVGFGKNLSDMWSIPYPLGMYPIYATISKDGSSAGVVFINPSVMNSAKAQIYNREGIKTAEIPLQSIRGQDIVYIKPNFDGSVWVVEDRSVYTREGIEISSNPDSLGVDHNVEPYLSPSGGYVCNYAQMYTADFTRLNSRQYSGDNNDKGNRVKCLIPMVFLWDDSMVGDCSGTDNLKGLCIKTPSGEELIDNLGEKPTLAVDSASDDKTYVATTNEDKLYYIQNGQRKWAKDLHNFGDSVHLKRVSISPGGNYVTALSTSGTTYQLLLFDGAGNDLLNYTIYDQWRYGSFYDVKATSSGIYYLRHDKDGKVTFGKFTNTPKPKTDKPSEKPKPQTTTTTQNQQQNQDGFFGWLFSFFT